MQANKVDQAVQKRMAVADQQTALELSNLPSWQWYTDKLAEIEQGYIKRLVSCSKDEHDRLAGCIEGLRVAYYLPHKVLATKID